MSMYGRNSLKWSVEENHIRKEKNQIHTGTTCAIEDVLSACSPDQKRGEINMFFQSGCRSPFPY